MRRREQRLAVFFRSEAANTHFSLVYAIFAQAPDKNRIEQTCFANHVKGVTLIANADFPLAFEYHSRALALSSEHDLPEHAFQCHTNLGICSLKMKKFHEASSHFTACISAANTKFKKAKSLYHQAMTHLYLKETADCDKLAREAIDICVDSVSQLEAEARMEEERLKKEAEEKGLQEEGANKNDEKKDRQAKDDESLGTADDSAATVRANAPVAFNSREGAVLHSQLCHLSSLNHLCRTSGNVADPDVSAALESLTDAASLSSRSHCSLAKALTLSTSGIASAISGDNEAAKKFHSQALRIIDDKRSYALQSIVEEPAPSLKPEISTVLQYSSFTRSSLDKKILQSKALYNQGLSARNGVGMGLAMESGTGAMEASKMRPIMDIHKKVYESCDRSGEKVRDILLFTSFYKEKKRKVQPPCRRRFLLLLLLTPRTPLYCRLYLVRPVSSVPPLPTAPSEA